MKKWVLLILFCIFSSLAFLAYRFYSFIYAPNTRVPAEAIDFYIHGSTALDDLADTLYQDGILLNKKSFIWVADKMNFDQPRSGKYRIEKQLNNKEFVAKLRAAAQEPVQLTYNNVRTLDELCTLFGNELEASRQEFCGFFTDSLVLSSLGLDRNTLMSLFIPNTYEVYWNITPARLLERMKKEHDAFWNTGRKQKLQRVDLSEIEAYTLASIVQKESNLASEKPVIAGVYLNRLKRGMLLQADPTVVYAIGDFEMRRVLNKHLLVDSPYNTYKYPGLPPGPICMPDISSIDAVLNAEEHDYIYFCVKPGTGFEHAFARNLTEHNRNAAEYRRWLNNNRIFN